YYLLLVSYVCLCHCFFLTVSSSTSFYTLSLHDALPIYLLQHYKVRLNRRGFYMKCRKCNLPIQKDDKNCPHCGAKVKRPAKLIFLSSLALVFIMGAVIATFWFQDELPNITDQSAKQNPVSVTDSDEDKEQDKNDKAKEKNEKKT